MSEYVGEKPLFDRYLALQAENERLRKENDELTEAGAMLERTIGNLQRAADSVLCDAAQLMDGWKQAAPQDWTEWDQQVRDQIAALREAKPTQADLSKIVNLRPSNEPLSRYQCMVEGCPGDHPSKMDVCSTAQPPSAGDWPALAAEAYEKNNPNLPSSTAALHRLIERHLKWREQALCFLHQVVDGRGCEDEWPALAEFIEQSEARLVRASETKREAP